MGFTSLTTLNAKGITTFIVENISKWGINIQNCVAQSYDGANVLSGALSGVQTRIREIVE